MKNYYTHTIKLISAISMSCFFTLSYAQDKVKGITLDLISSEKISAVTITNTRTHEVVASDQEGNFSIAAQLNDYLAIATPGFERDTVYIYDFGVKRVYLNKENNAIELSEVYIERMSDNKLASEIESTKIAGEYADLKKERAGIRVSPSRIFGKDGKRARENYKLLINEQQKRRVDRLFSDELIQSVTPLKDAQLALFKEQYRPHFKNIEYASVEDLKLYIMDAYKKFNSKK